MSEWMNERPTAWKDSTRLNSTQVDKILKLNFLCFRFFFLLLNWTELYCTRVETMTRFDLILMLKNIYTTHKNSQSTLVDVMTMDGWMDWMALGDEKRMSPNPKTEEKICQNQIYSYIHETHLCVNVGSS